MSGKISPKSREICRMTKMDNAKIENTWTETDGRTGTGVCDGEFGGGVG